MLKFDVTLSVHTDSTLSVVSRGGCFRRQKKNVSMRKMGVTGNVLIGVKATAVSVGAFFEVEKRRASVEKNDVTWSLRVPLSGQNHG